MLLSFWRTLDRMLDWTFTTIGELINSIPDALSDEAIAEGLRDKVDYWVPSPSPQSYEDIRDFKSRLDALGRRGYRIRYEGKREVRSYVAAALVMDGRELVNSAFVVISRQKGD